MTSGYLAKASCAIRVRVGPGATEFTRVPRVQLLRQAPGEDFLPALHAGVGRVARREPRVEGRVAGGVHDDAAIGEQWLQLLGRGDDAVGVFGQMLDVEGGQFAAPQRGDELPAAARDRGRRSGPTPGSVGESVVVARLYESDVVGFCLWGDSGVEHLLPCLLSDSERSLVSRGELVCIDVGGDAFGEGDPGGLVADLEHVPARIRRVARHHVQVSPDAVRLLVVHRDAPINRLIAHCSVVTSG
jgi:hypothetical protein